MQEISKRDTIITRLLTVQMVNHMKRYGTDPETLRRGLKYLTLEPVELEEFCKNAQDEAIFKTLEQADDGLDTNPHGHPRSQGHNIKKAEALRAQLNKVLSPDYAKRLENEIVHAVNDKRISLLKQID